MAVETITERAAWNSALAALPRAHILQSWEWGDFKQATTGWTPQRLQFTGDDGSVYALASVLTRRLGPVAVMYVPRGPVLVRDDSALLARVLDHLQDLARKRGAIWLKIDPGIPAATGIPGDDDDTPYLPGAAMQRELDARGWQFSADQVQFRNTIVLDLTRPADEILAAMSQNTRRKIRTAAKKGVHVRPATVADLPTLYDLYRVTGSRDDFLIRPADYYERAWRDFMHAGLAHALIAEVEGEPVAQVILFRFGATCWYMYGASSDAHREKMPNYALQWSAIRWAQEQGCTQYDFWGAPDHFDASDRMWGVYEFKRGFRGTVIRTPGAYDYAPVPALYRAYTEFWPRIREMLRR